MHRTELTLQVISFAETRTGLANRRARLQGICALETDDTEMLLFSLRAFTEVAQEKLLWMRGHARYIKSQFQRTDSFTANFFSCFLRNLTCYLRLSDKSNHLFENSETKKKKKIDKSCIRQSFVLFRHYSHNFCFNFQVSSTYKTPKTQILFFSHT